MNCAVPLGLALHACENVHQVVHHPPAAGEEAVCAVQAPDVHQNLL